MKKKSIWVIEQGAYSDYRVVGVFTTKKNAELVLSAIHNSSSWDTPSLAEWTLNPGVDALNAGLQPYEVLMLRDGTTEKIDLKEISSYSFDTVDTGFIWNRTQVPAYRGTGTPDCLNITVWAKSPKHAIKIVNERRTHMIANGEWK